mgnify:CR=1 FL=1
MSDSMRDFFGDLGKRIGETAETMTNRAGDVIEIQRLKAQIRELARGNAVDLMELGKTIYDRYKAGEEVSESEKALCDAIQNREESMSGYEKKISKIRGASECASCGKMVAKDMTYCPYCGAKTAAPASEAEEEEGDPAEDVTAEGSAVDTVDQMKEKVSEAVEHAADRAEETAGKAVEKAGEMADKAAEKAEEMAGKAGEAADKAADKVGDLADRVAEKIGEAAQKAADKINGRD